MNKKILLGSIIAVVILVLVSFTGVVGYQTTSSTIAKASPLFSVRTSRAIDEESKDLTCDYVGKGKGYLISIPKRDDTTTLIQKFINRVSKMDDKTFNKFIFLVINKIHKNNIIKEEQTSEIIREFQHIREDYSHYLIAQKNARLGTFDFFSCPLPSIGVGCFIYLIISILLAIIGGNTTYLLTECCKECQTL